MSMDLAASKRRLRMSLKDRILGMPAQQRAVEEAALAASFEHLPGFAAAETVLLYVSAFAEEFSTRPMLVAALSLRKRLICPRVIRRESRLALFEIRNLATDLVPGVLGIPEPTANVREILPKDVDWVLVPGLGFDVRCYRIGRGAGYYDRLLSRLRPEVPRWSLCLTSQWVDALPVEPHDQPLNGVADAYRLISRP
jgi:5-formyltetrahydrofolate cyclo-ligase